ncbi:hypothetical protein AUJ46_06515 [Candidatus Peregrinibacteria bacterium CG1_02_54_53]|nr:MAG: hypothetical protein AUJ46_06515 [Candidatus Peregrinibacteria bacterium CG1_02_54_53]
MLLPLSDHGILGLNARSLLYIKPFNPKKAMAFADDKMRTKMFLGSRGIPVARVFARIENRRQLRSFNFDSLPDECVLKPNEGYGGDGILVLRGRRGKIFLENGKIPVSERDLRDHIEDILDGKYSVSGVRDIAFFEQILTPDKCFARFRPVGLPDIRVITFNLVPVMAMLRIPTAESRGKANVHLGGIGIGLDIDKGTTTHAAQYNHIIHNLPHGVPSAGIEIPFWDDILLICSRIQQLTNIGYLAVDITIDADLGPTLLEVNARAGLMVQVANLAPLRSRLERVAGLKVSSPEKGVRIGKELFGLKTSRIAPEKNLVTLGTRETIEIAGEGNTVEIAVRIDPERERTTFHPELIVELLRQEAIESAGNDRYRVKFLLGGKKVQTAVDVDTLLGPERAVIGRRDLTGFLIDPLRTRAAQSKLCIRQDLHAVDRLLAKIDSTLPVLRLVKPVNLEEERSRAEADPLYQPLFQYAPLPDDLEDLQMSLSTVIQDSSDLGQLLEKKRKELLLRLTMLDARGKDAKQFTDASLSLFGEIRESDVQEAMANFLPRPSKPPKADESALSAAQAQQLLQDAIDHYGLHDWHCVLRDSIVADCTVGGRTIALRSRAKFTKSHVDALIAHEIETHAITAENGTHQSWHLLRKGTANYLTTQEGLAIWNQNRVLPAWHIKRYRPAQSLLAVSYAQTHSFKDTRLYLEEKLGYPVLKALNKAIDVKRGISDTSQPGAFIKGAVYFLGHRAIESFVKNDGDLKRLYWGKVSIEDLSFIERIPDLRPPLLLPDWLRRAS